MEVFIAAKMIYKWWFKFPSSCLLSEGTVIMVNKRKKLQGGGTLISWFRSTFWWFYLTMYMDFLWLSIPYIYIYVYNMYICIICIYIYTYIYTYIYIWQMVEITQQIWNLTIHLWVSDVYHRNWTLGISLVNIIILRDFIDTYCIQWIDAAPNLWLYE